MAGGREAGNGRRPAAPTYVACTWDPSRGPETDKLFELRSTAATRRTPPRDGRQPRAAPTCTLSRRQQEESHSARRRRREVPVPIASSTARLGRGGGTSPSHWPGSDLLYVGQATIVANSKCNTRAARQLATTLLARG